MKRAWAVAVAVVALLCGVLVSPAGASAAPAGSFGETVVIAKVPVDSEYIASTGQTIVLSSVNRRVVAKGKGRTVWVKVKGSWRRAPYRFDPVTYTLAYDEARRQRIGGDPLGGRQARRVASPTPASTPSPTPLPSEQSAPNPAAESALGPTWRSDVVTEVNRVRSQAGVPSLRLCPALSRAAQAWANHAAETGVFAHTDATSTIWDRISAAGYASTMRLHGENMEQGAATVDEAMAAWVNSPQHYENLVTPQFTHVGIGAARGADGRLVWVQDFSFGGRCE